MRRILIIGASGQLGSALVEVFSDYDLLTPTHDEFDITDEAENLTAFLETMKPSVVINCAAFHDVKACEEDPATAYDVNSDAVMSLALLCKDRGIELAHISTDYVLDDEAQENPLNVYGLSKLRGERIARAVHKQSYIFRTSGLYGKSGLSNKGPTFIERVLQAAERRETFRAVNDVSFSPSYAPHVARAMRKIIEAKQCGLHNVAGTGTASWYEFASYARWCAFYGGRASDMGELEPVSIRDLNETIIRPLKTCLGNGTLPDWREGVREYVAQRKSQKVAA